MDRGIIYPGSIPLDSDILGVNQRALIGIGALAKMALGQTTVVDGLIGTQTTTASLTINIGPGSILSLQEVDANAYGSLGTNTNPLVKMGINLTSTPFTLTAPGTAGQSINYLIEAQFLEQDGTPVVLPYVNPANPSSPYSGPANAGTAQNTVRAETVSLQLKSGAAATTGTQTTPATDAGWVPLYVITVNYGQTTITTAEIVQASGAPFIPVKLPNVQTLGGVIAQARNLTMNVIASSASATLTADEITVETALGGFSYRLPSFNATVNLSTVGVGGMDTGAAPVSGYVALYAIYNPSTLASALLATNATAAIAPNVYGGANMPAGYTASALVSVWPTNSGGNFVVGFQTDRSISIPNVTALSSSTNQTAFTALSISTIVPKNAKTISGTLQSGTNFSGNFTASVTIAGNNLGVGYTLGGLGNMTSSSGGYSYQPFANVPLITPQTIYYQTNIANGTPSYGVYISGYTI